MSDRVIMALVPGHIVALKKTHQYHQGHSIVKLKTNKIRVSRSPKFQGFALKFFCIYLCVNVCYNDVHVLQNPRAKLTQSLEKIFSRLKKF